jgi:glyoxylase-like metal-dependent hydrolase (beta-lactamase superfamily II)
MATIYPLSEGVFTIGRDKEFVPFDLDQDVLNERPTGSLLVEVVPFLVVTDKDVLLLDTGLGFKNSQGELQIHENIRRIGYEPGDVTKVLMSHLHKDHAGGVSFTNSAGAAEVSFPNATYYVYRPEAGFALETGYPSYHPDEIEPLLRSTQLEWLDDAEGVIDSYIRYWHTGGHSPEHIVFLIEDGGEKIFFGGDEAPQLKQMKIKYVAKYDFDGKKAMALRGQWAEQGHREGWEALFYHDVNQPVVRL